jgi:hypothetical protein
MAKKATLFTVFKSKKGNIYYRPNIGKFGVAKMKVELNDGTRLEFNGEETVFKNCPFQSLQYRVENGKLDPEKAAQIEEKLKNAGIVGNLDISY